MTREEAIKVLNMVEAHGIADEAKRMAIEALSENSFLKDMIKFYRNEDYEHATLVDIKEPLRVLVVRCKDCRHRDLFSCPLADNDFQKDDDYCSWGERR